MIIVSLTTTKSRLSLCRLALLSLCYQEVKPDKIIVWVSGEAYLKDEGISSEEQLSSFFYDLNDFSQLIEFKWTENIGPYRKLLPLLRECQENDIIVTADDDICYGKRWLRVLVDTFEEFGQSYPVAARVRNIKKNRFGGKTSYVYWPIINDSVVVSSNYVITYGGGVVLKKSFFDYTSIHSDDFKEIAPTTDDLWYSKLLSEKRCSVVVVPDALSELYFIEHGEGLVNYNWPKLNGIVHKLKWHLYCKVVGYFGFSICGNDTAYKSIEKYYLDK